MRFAFLLAAFVLLAACGPTAVDERPIPVVRLKGSPKEMGEQHGRRFGEDIRTLYVRFLAAQVLPYLNRQQKVIDDTFLGLPGYMKKDEYQDGKFAYRFLLDSAETLAQDQPDDYWQEIDGIAAGAGLAIEEARILNTFGDTLLGMLALSFYTDREKAPVLASVRLAAAENDRLDNDGDGLIDEADEAEFAPLPLTDAARLRVGPGRIELVLVDADGVQEDPLLLRVNGVDVPQSERTYRTAGTATTLTFDAAPYWHEGWNTLSVQASDRSLAEEPPPVHPYTMRQVRLLIGGVKASGKAVNAGYDDPPGAATSLAVAADDGSFVARNFVLLDADTAHDHAAVFVFEPSPTPENSAPRRYAIVGWAGASWALTGMNDAGQAVSVNIVETLDNGVARGIDEGLFPKARGMTFGAVGRYVLARNFSPAEFRAAMSGIRAASGVVVQLADAERGTVTTCELRAGLLDRAPAACYGTDSTGPALRPAQNYVGSFAAYQALYDDAGGNLLDGISPILLKPQRFWSTEWLESYSTYGRLMRVLGADDPGQDPLRWIETLRTPGIASKRNSMHSAIMLPGREMWVGAGRLPSTESPFFRLTAEELFP